MISVAHHPSGKLAVRFPYDAALVELMRGVPGRGWEPADKAWLIPEESLGVLLARANGREVQFDDHARQVLASHKPDASRRLAPGVPICCPPGLSLMPFQEAAVHWIERCGGRALLGDEVGCGKSIEALGYIRLHPELRPVLVICPATMKLTWEREAIKWLDAPPDRVKVLEGTAPEPTGKSTVLIANYDILFSRKEGVPCWADVLAPAIVVVDEIQACKEQKAKRSKAVAQIADRAKAVIGLSGTPVLNRPMELFHQLRIINKGLFSNWFQFGRRYCNPQEKVVPISKKAPPRKGDTTDEKGRRWRKVTDFKGASNLDELESILRRNVMIRRLKREVLAELPEMTKATLWADAKKTEAYKQLELSLRSKARQYKQAGDVLRQQLADAPTTGEQKLILAKQAAADARFKLRGLLLSEITALRQEIGLMKLPAVVEWATEFLEGNPQQKLVVFAWHVAIQKKLFLELARFGAAPILGDMNVVQRQESIYRFQNNPEVRVAVLSINAASQGITLTAASNVLMAELPWNPAMVDQCGGRVARIGQKSACVQWFMVAADTLDERIAELLDKKRVVVAASTGDVAPIETDTGVLDALVDSLADGC